MVGIGHHDGFRDFEIQARGVDLVLLKGLCNGGDEMGIHELPAGAVKAHGKSCGRELSGPESELSGAFTDDPLSDGDDESGLFGERNEIVGRDDPALGVVPSEQCFETKERGIVNGNNGLIGENELLFLKSAAQVAFEGEPGEVIAVHLG